MSFYDAAVFGGGAAGLSRALILSRARREVRTAVRHLAHGVTPSSGRTSTHADLQETS